jgi:hypothetical protein
MSYAAGGSVLHIEPGVYFFLIELISGLRVRIDYIEFIDSSNPVEPASWGRIKSMYR